MCAIVMRTRLRRSVVREHKIGVYMVDQEKYVIGRRDKLHVVNAHAPESITNREKTRLGNMLSREIHFTSKGRKLSRTLLPTPKPFGDIVPSKLINKPSPSDTTSKHPRLIARKFRVTMIKEAQSISKTTP